MTHKGNTSIIIQMKVFDDQITLWNGGTLPPGYTVEMLMEPHESHPRNRLMANVFYLAGFIEAWGRGYEKIRESFEKDKLEVPVFEEVRGGMMATIKREKFMAIQAKGGHLLCGFLQFLHQGQPPFGPENSRLMAQEAIRCGRTNSRRT